MSEARAGLEVRRGFPVEVGEHEVELGGERRRYMLRRAARSTLAITVEPGGALVVTAPLRASVAQVEQVLRKRRRWIRSRTAAVAALPAPVPPRAWVSGETHRYLGRQYRLRVRAGATPSVRLVDGWFEVRVPEPRDTEAVQRLMEGWYRVRAREVVTRRLEEVVRRTPRLRLREVPPVTIRRLRTRWGSCSPAGRITINVDAVKLPVGCLDYLLVHELCHLRVANHGAAFWRLLSACMPDWERWRRRLDAFEF